MRRLGVTLIVGAVFSILTAGIMAEPYPDRRMFLPYQAKATVEDLWALRYNPAALAVNSERQILYAHTYNDSDLAGNDLIYFGTHGLAFGIEWLGSGGEKKARHYTLAWGREIKDRIFFGLSHRWIRSDDPDEHGARFWTASIMVRPGRLLSFGLQAENINHARYRGLRTDAIYTYSAGINLLDGRVIIGGDFHQSTGQRLADASYRLTAAMEPLDGLIIFGDYGDRAHPLYDKSGAGQKFGLGIRLNLAEWMVSSANAFNNDGEFFRGSFAIGAYDHRRRQVVHRPREIADIYLDGRLSEKPPPRFFLLPADRPSTTSFVH